jgi:hypothetical protein
MEYTIVLLFEKSDQFDYPQVKRTKVDKML